MRYRLLLLLLSFLPAAARAQDAPASLPVKYWVFFTDKEDAAGKTAPEASYVTERARWRRSLRASTDAHTLDAPLSARYVGRLVALGVAPLTRSRWLNAVSAVMDDATVARVRTLPFVRSIRPVAGIALPPAVAPQAKPPLPYAAASAKTTRLDYGPSEAQLAFVNAIPPLERGINGTGVIVGFLDTNFDSLRHPAFDALRAEGRLLGLRDFTQAPQGNKHAVSVASVAVGFDEGNIVGPGYGAMVLGATTEYDPTETNQEEDNLVAGLEWLERNGADVANISLGYSEFDPGQHSYSTADLDGNTGITTRAVDVAASLGLAVVNSAGNKGCSSPRFCWFYITTPADADSVIAVGAARSDSTKASFSGVGPTADGRIKPDVSALGVGALVASGSGYVFGNGTSFAAPMVTGVVAQILQVNPSLDPAEVRALLRETASQALFPDVRLGWGIINADAAVKEASMLVDAAQQTAELPTTVEVGAVYPNPAATTAHLDVRMPAAAAAARLVLYDLLGRQVAVPFRGTLLAGANVLALDVSTLAPGLYLYDLRAGATHMPGKLVVAR